MEKHNKRGTDLSNVVYYLTNRVIGVGELR